MAKTVTLKEQEVTWMRKLRCIIGWHSWRVASETDVESTGVDDGPMEFEVGGIDYLIRCAHCPASWVLRKRGFWIAPAYPPLET